VSSYLPVGTDGHTIRWSTWDHESVEEVSISWENEAWTVSGAVGRERVQYVFRLSPAWQVRQFLLFRDLDEPDLWLASDGGGRWGEVNGAHRTDLDGCYDLDLPCTPFTRSIPVHRLPLHVGHTAEITVARIDVDTLEVSPEPHRYTRLASHRWQLTRDAEPPMEFDVDEHGLVVDEPQRFRRL
jgi:hypothetical protein